MAGQAGDRASVFLAVPCRHGRAMLGRAVGDAAGDSAAGRLR